MKTLRKIYLAIPYSKWDVDLSYEIANEVSAHFINLGFNVFSPITHSHPLTKYGLRGDFDFWEKMDKQYVDWCDEIVVIIPPTYNGLELIESSVGVQGEIEHGEKTGKPHRFFDYKTKKFVKIPELTVKR
jgi:hypothetical protein